MGSDVGTCPPCISTLKPASALRYLGSCRICLSAVRRISPSQRVRAMDFRFELQVLELGMVSWAYGLQVLSRLVGLKA